MEELIRLIQSDQQLWEIVEQLKSQDEELQDFLLNVANMMAVEFEELHRTDLTDKLVALFGGLPEPAFKLVPGILHVALDIFLMKAIPNHDAIKNWSMNVGYVLYEPDENKVLCLSKNNQGVELKDAKNGINLDNSLCLKDITSIKSIYEKFKKCSLVDNLDIVNISQLYQNCV